MRTRRPWIRVTVDPVNHVGSVAGRDAKERIEACGGRPYWHRSRRVWMTSEAVAGDVLAMAELDGLAVQFSHVARGDS